MALAKAEAATASERDRADALEAELALTKAEAATGSEHARANALEADLTTQRPVSASTHAPDHNSAPVETKSAPEGSGQNEVHSDAVTESRLRAAAEAASTPLRAALSEAKAATASERRRADTLEAELMALRAASSYGSVAVSGKPGGLSSPASSTELDSAPSPAGPATEVSLRTRPRSAVSKPVEPLVKPRHRPQSASASAQRIIAQFRFPLDAVGGSAIVGGARGGESRGSNRTEPRGGGSAHQLATQSITTV